MGAVGVIAVLAFLIYLIAQFARRPRAAVPGGAAPVYGAHWYELLLAAVVLLVAVVLAVWQLAPGAAPDAAAADWRSDSRAVIFFVVMLVLAALGLVVFAIYAIARSPRAAAAEFVARQVPAAAAEAAGTAAVPAIPTPSGARLLGLLLLLLAILLLNWIYLDLARQYALMQTILYPASFAVALVLLFDKATRAWSTKGAAETVREWMLCDAMVFLLVLGYLHLLDVAAADTYHAMFWDLLHIALFFLVFWMVDRLQTRYRFLIGQAYLIALPILLLIWRVIEKVAAPEDLSWWSTIWPFFILAIIGFVLEIIALIATSGSDRHGAVAIKDAVIFVIYGILLIVAIPEAAA